MGPERLSSALSLEIHVAACCYMVASCYSAHPGHSQGCRKARGPNKHRLPAGVCSHLQQHCALCHGWPQWHCVCLWSHQQWQDIHNDGEASCTCVQSHMLLSCCWACPGVAADANLAQPAGDVRGSCITLAPVSGPAANAMTESTSPFGGCSCILLLAFPLTGARTWPAGGGRQSWCGAASHAGCL